jgi:hypothetical protein
VHQRSVVVQVCAMTGAAHSHFSEMKEDVFMQVCAVTGAAHSLFSETKEEGLLMFQDVDPRAELSNLEP